MSDAQPSEFFSGLAIGRNHCLPQILRHVAKFYGSKPFCVSETGVVTSFAEFERRVQSLGAALVGAGIELGDRIAIWAPNSPEWIVAASAIESIGAVMVPINTRFKGLESRYILEKTRAKILFTSGSFPGLNFAALLREACGDGSDDRPFAELPHLQSLIDIGQPGFAPGEVTVDTARLYDRAAGVVTPDTIADILFTSGTTGRPKGAMHNHGQALWMVGRWNEANDLRATDRMLIVNPFFHSFGYRSGWVSALVAGMTVFPMAVFDPRSVLEVIERERITVLGGSPTLFHSLLEHPDLKKFDISSLRCGQTGGAGSRRDIIRAGYEQLGFEIFLTSFGQTESTALISSNRAGDDIETLCRTVGRPVSGVDVRIIDAEGGDVAMGSGGELIVRGPNVMQGYFEDPDQTAQVIDADGWLHTGDVACIDASGRLRILDRMKDVVIVGGFNAYPAEIENMLGEHPAIADVAVIGVPDRRMGEVCAACVVLRGGRTLAMDDLTDWSRERMANYKVPRQLFLFESLPRTPLGKVQKFVLREMVKDKAAL